MIAESYTPLAADLAGQVAIVTGASRGLGRAIALRLATAGARVACIARDESKLAETVAAIRDSGGTAEPHACDVTDAQQIASVVESIGKAWGSLEILVNNAGITRDTLFPRMKDEEWDDVINTNLRGAFLFTRAMTRPMLRARYGRVINISSVSGLVGNPGQANYSASKAGLIGMTRSVARELAGRKITVNAIAPGFIESDMSAALGEAVIDEVTKRIPAKRLGKAEEVAACALFLASRDASYVTGQVLVVDGGMTG